MFVWNSRVTGSWKRTPHADYAHLYIPEDRMGFGETGNSPAVPLSVEQQSFESAVRSTHREHTLSKLPSIALSRAAFLIQDTWAIGTFGAALAFVGLLWLPTAVRLLLCATVLTLFASYLLYASVPWWTLYYLELQPIFAFLTASGAFGVSKWLFEKPVRVWNRNGPQQSVTGQESIASRLIPYQPVFFLLSAWLVVVALIGLPAIRRGTMSMRRYVEAFHDLIAALPADRSIVFVRYAPKHNIGLSLVDNEPDLSTARTWIVHDRGSENARLLAFAPDRTAFLYWEWRDADRVHGEVSLLDAATTPDR